MGPQFFLGTPRPAIGQAKNCISRLHFLACAHRPPAPCSASKFRAINIPTRHTFYLAALAAIGKTTFDLAAERTSLSCSVATSSSLFCSPGWWRLGRSSVVTMLWLFPTSRSCRPPCSSKPSRPERLCDLYVVIRGQHPGWTDGPHGSVPRMLVRRLRGQHGRRAAPLRSRVHRLKTQRETSKVRLKESEKSLRKERQIVRCV